ncbi:hypothetical protein DNTS_009108 [Danionella cerebrum]|uniref:Uncharacterized protein n=1 Tax=Danionella cerebrum TaxID=2873325 RepID=A0A553QAN5_9TELE|nr:hypothetical protein DNTS_009108 [Danionella translucida]
MKQVQELASEALGVSKPRLNYQRFCNLKDFKRDLESYKLANAQQAVLCKHRRACGFSLTLNGGSGGMSDASVSEDQELRPVDFIQLQQYIDCETAGPTHPSYTHQTLGLITKHDSL